MLRHQLPGLLVLLSLTLLATVRPVLSQQGARSESARSAAENRREIERLESELDEHLRRVPPELDLDALGRRIELLAEANGLTMSTALARVGTAPAPLRVPDRSAKSPIELHRLTLSASGDPLDIAFFLDRLGRQAAAPFIVEQVELAPRGREVAASIRVLAPIYSTNNAVIGEASQLTQLIEALEQLADTQRATRLAAGLVALLGKLADLPLAVTSLRVDDSVSVEGFVDGALPIARLEAALESHASVETIESKVAGPCRVFSARLRLDLHSTEITSPSLDGLFDGSAPVLCRDEAVARLPAIEVSGATERDGYHLRLRDIEAADLYQVLHHLTGIGFVVEPEVSGRVNAAIGNASIEELFEAFESLPFELEVDQITRVSTGSSPVRSQSVPISAEVPVSVSVKGLPFTALLCRLAGAADMVVRMPPYERTVSLFVDTALLSMVLQHLVESTGLLARVEGQVVTLQEAGGATSVPLTAVEPTDACDQATPPYGPLRSALEVSEPSAVPLSDLRLVGFAREGAGPTRAYAYGRGPRLHTLVAGLRFQDGVVEEVGVDSVRFSTSSGTVEMRLLPEGLR